MTKACCKLLPYADLTLAPTAFQMNALKRVVAPLLVLALVFALTQLTIKRGECSRICEAKGYAHSDLIPPSRGTANAKCYCITAEEHERSRENSTVPRDVRVY